MAELYEEDMKKSLKPLYWMLSPGAVWPCDSPHRWVHIAHGIHRFNAASFYTFITISEITFMFQNLDDFDVWTDAAATIFTTLTALIKMCFAFGKRHYLNRVFRQFLFSDYGFFMPFVKEVHTNQGLWEREKTGDFKKYLNDSMQDGLRECRFLFKTLGNALGITLVEYVLVAFFLTLYYHNKEGHEGRKWFLAFRTAVPWDWEQPVNYALTMIMQILAAAVTMQGFGMDLLFGAVMVMINRQYKILGNIVENLDVFAEVYRTDSGRRLVDGQEQTKEEFEASDDACCKLFVECVEHYDRLLMECNLIDKKLGFVFLTQFVTSSLTLCLVTYKASTEQNIGNLCIYLVYFVAACSQLLVYCYYGERMLELGEHLGDLAYQTPWMDRSIKFQHSIRMFIRQAQRQMRITAWGFSDLSLPTFTSILSSAMSYFTLLRSMNEPME
uniref:Odorant receptor n=1 Tax=Eriocrania semipurpurella TaxID=41180 RepID=A0A2H4NT95_9NEOP|nr:odorant receptor 3 [Eriocrania semipurpurella]